MRHTTYLQRLQSATRRAILCTVTALMIAFPAQGFVLADDPVPDPSDTATQAPADPTPSDPPADTTPPTDQTPPPDQASAADTTPAPSASTPTNTCPKPSSGVNRPGGAASGTYKFNSATCLWENNYYTWDPISTTYSAKYSYPYVYNPATGKWDSQVWDFYPSYNKYLLDTFSVAQPPAGAQTINAANPSTAGLTVSNGNTLNMSNLTNVQAQNILASIALSGDASLYANTNAGSAMSGNALAMANVLNMLQSTSSLGNATLFTANINGSVQGDLLIDPSMLQGGSANLTNTANLQVNNQTNASIDNNLTLTAVSGDATVAKNTNAGDAITGSANAVANVVNMINSMIGSNQSFIGVINIMGDLNGNILMPQQFLDSLIASNAPRTTVDINNNNTSDIDVNNTSTQHITNQVNSQAVSGNATLDKNTNAGNATTGQAATKVTIFNLTGEQVVGKDSLLVFVNVLGNWVGMIMNAPGATAAAFGGSVTATNTNTLNADIDNTSNQSITNDINLTAQSGDATVTKNTKAGDAVSGSANTAANIANFENDQFSLSDWFGVLFINVFGNWNGSFGVFNPLAQSSSTPGSGSGVSGAPAGGAPQVFAFHAKFAPSASGQAAGASTPSGPITPALASAAKKVLGASTHFTAPKHVVASSTHLLSNIIAIVLVGTGISLLGVERYLTFKNSRA